MILVTLAKLNAPEGVPLNVVIPAPPSYLKEVKPVLQAALLNADGTPRAWEIQMKGDKKPRKYLIGKVIVVAEGVPAYCAYRYDLNGNVVALPDAEGHDYLSGTVAVLDLGFGTADLFTITNGNINADSIQHATDDAGGILSLVIAPILDEVKNLPGSNHITKTHVDGWLRKWVQTEYNPAAATIQIGSSRVNLHAKFNQALDQYADFVMATYLKRLPTAFTVMEVGGGWLYIEQRVKTVFKRTVFLSPRMFPHIEQVPLWELNSYGGLVMLAASRRYKGSPPSRE